MTQAAEAVLQAIEHLSPEERDQVFKILLRQVADEGYESFSDDELLAAGRVLSEHLDDYESE